ncbi:MAG: GPP34 family phosphoprotein [Opitutales bacterium]|nr:GPP34 family phosphoprotein [Opitutales bacterium]
MIDTLSLAEDVVLLALDEGSGRLRSLPDRALDYALAGAFLAELTRAGHVSLEGEGVRIRKGDPPEDARMAAVFREVARQEPRSLAHVLSFLAAEGTELRERVVEDLVRKGVLEETEEAVLWVFHRTRYPAIDHRQEEIVRARLRRIILGGEEMEPSEEDVILVGLVHACQLEHLVLSEEELRGNREHIQALSRSHVISRTVFDTIQEIHRALLEIRTYSGW